MTVATDGMMDLGRGISPHIFESLHSRNHSWLDILGELVDNSFDANATRVVIDFSKSKELSVTDDGKGCSDIERMLTVGSHMRTNSTALGRYGVGLKDAACWLWGELRIESVSKGVVRRACVNWEKLSRQPNFLVPRWTEDKPLSSMPVGTRLRFVNFQRNRPAMDGIVLNLGYTFWPALLEGKQIVVLGPRKYRETCSAWSPPPMSDIVEDSFHVDGKHVSLKAGIVPPDDRNVRSGFNFAYGHRHIFNSSLGSRGHSTSRICGVVRLGKEWRLTTNKTSIDEDTKALEAAIWERCQGIIEKSAAHAQSILNRELELSVSQKLKEFLSQKKREKRSPGESNGTAQPKDTGRTRRKASKTSNRPGSVEDFVDCGLIRMEWRSREDGLLGEVDLPGNVIYLNDQHRRLDQHRQSRNEEALVDHGLALLAYEVFEKNEQGKFPFSKDHTKVLGALSNLTNAQADSTAAVAT